jgi:hypothetical protein
MSKIDSKTRVNSSYIPKTQTGSDNKVNKIGKIKTVSRTATEIKTTPAVKEHTAFESLSKIVMQLKGEDRLSYIDENIITSILRDSKKNEHLKKILEDFLKSKR